MKKLIKQAKKGFTLVELLVVIAILAVLASVSVVGYLGFTEKARVSDDNTELHQIGTLVQAELIDGSEDVLVADEGHDGESHASCTAYYVNFKYDNNVVSATKSKAIESSTTDTSLTDANVLTAIQAMVEGESSEMAGYLTTATVANGVLTLKYKHHASSESTWTLGTSTAE